MWKVKNFGENIANAVFKYTDGELKIREATNDEPWGPHGALLQEITQMISSREEFTPMMEMLFLRIRDNENNWRRVYKGLLVLEYLLKNGSDRAIEYSKGRMYILKKVERSKYVDNDGKNQSINVNHRSTEIISLLNDENRLKAERDKARIGSNRIVSTQNSNFDYYSKYESQDKGGIGRTIRESLKTAVTTVVDKIQTIRMSQNDNIEGLEDEFKVSRHGGDDFDDTVGTDRRIADNYGWDIFETASDHLSGIENNKTENDDFGNFVGSQAQNEPNNEDLLTDIFSVAPAQAKNSANNKLPDLISFENKNNSTLQMDDIFSSLGSSNIQLSVDCHQSTSPSYNTFNRTDDFLANNIVNSIQQPQQNLQLGLEGHSSAYISPSYRNQYQPPVYGNIYRTGSPYSGNSSGALGRSNPMSLSSMANSSHKKETQAATVDDMIRDSLESFSKTTRDPKLTSTLSYGTSIMPLGSNQIGNHGANPNGNSFDPFF